MIKNNICKFIPQVKRNEKMGIINFVYEKDNFLNKEFRMASTYILFVICKNSGFFHTHYKSYPVDENDVVLAYPSTSFYFESKDNNKNIEYAYISFISDSTLDLISKTGFSKMSLVQRNVDPFLKEFWMKSLSDSILSNLELLTTSVLQYTFAILQKNTTYNYEKYNENDDIALLLKKRIDETYNNPKTNLNSLAHELGYSPNYLSSIFEKKYDVSFSKYINKLRINAAEDLMSKGLKSIKQISLMCGFSDAFYFSKKFKLHTKKTPSEYIKYIKNSYENA